MGEIEIVVAGKLNPPDLVLFPIESKLVKYKLVYEYTHCNTSSKLERGNYDIHLKPISIFQEIPKLEQWFHER
jgi:hypothetical protein